MNNGPLITTDYAYLSFISHLSISIIYSHLFIYFLFIPIYLIFISLFFIPIYLIFISLLFISYRSPIHPSPIRHRDGRQNTVMRRHCAPEGEAQPPHDGILPACL
jgi:hypothetical protein